MYDEWFITLYNLMYTALPVLGMSLFDQVAFCCMYLCVVQRTDTKSTNRKQNKRYSCFLCLPPLARMWMTGGASSILSSTSPVSSTSTSTERPSSSVRCTAATAPWCSSSSPTLPFRTQWETTAAMWPTTSPSPSSPRRACCSPSASRCEERSDGCHL